MSYNDEYNKEAIDFLNKHNASMTIEYREQVYSPWEDNKYHNAYDVTIERNNNSFTIDYKSSVYDTKNHVEPTEYDILACLEKYGYGSYKEFCEELGYAGSEETIKLYNAVQEEYNNVMRLFGDCIEELQEIQ